MLHHLDNYLSASQLGITLTGLIIGWVGEGSVAALLEPVIGKLLLVRLLAVQSLWRWDLF